MPLPRWFTVEEETGLFEISVLPVNYDDLMHKDFDSMEVLGVGPSPGGGDDGQVPTNVFFEIAYFQEGFDPKRLVSTGLAFEDLELLGDDEMKGVVLVNYNFTFMLTPMTHKDLTIAFAFSWDFYLVLYVIVGVLSLIIMFVFTLYHRIVARPKENMSVAAFKFNSYMSLTIPPALKGTGLALLPVILANIYMACVITGGIFGISTAIFDCNEPEGAVACALTIYDVITDQP